MKMKYEILLQWNIFLQYIHLYINWDIKRKTARKLLDNETWDFNATLSEPRHKLNPFYADFRSPPLFFVSAYGLK